MDWWMFILVGFMPSREFTFCQLSSPGDSPLTFFCLPEAPSSHHSLPRSTSLPPASAAKVPSASAHGARVGGFGNMPGWWYPRRAPQRNSNPLSAKLSPPRSMRTCTRHVGKTVVSGNGWVKQAENLQPEARRYTRVANLSAETRRC